MATYAELYDIKGNDKLKQRVAVACIVAADAIRTESSETENHSARMTWAKQALSDPERAADSMLWAILAQHKSLTTTQITEATDAALQTAVTNAVSVFAQ